ncbi:MAG TPA: hypothetical protein PLT51_04050, partial [Candidatus Dojkabacteria bacterium]|nr:hypothetical protein [Candidatus Dojkabacteria bacterium]
SCVLPDAPVLECVKASSYWRLKITNTNSEAVFFTVDGVLQSESLPSGAVKFINYPSQVTKTVAFKCVADQTVTSGPVTITLNC